MAHRDAEIAVDHDEGDDDDNNNDDDDGAALKAWWRQRQQKQHERRVKNVALFDAYFEMRQRCGDLWMTVDAKGAWSFSSNWTVGGCSCGAVAKFRQGQPPQDRRLEQSEHSEQLVDYQYRKNPLLSTKFQ